MITFYYINIKHKQSVTIPLLNVLYCVSKKPSMFQYYENIFVMIKMQAEIGFVCVILMTRCMTFREQIIRTAAGVQDFLVNMLGF